MGAPFIYGRIADENNFTDRETETARLVQQFVYLVNTIIISPRRWGKSSLVNKAAKIAMEQNSRLRVCIVDLFNVQSEEQFYSRLAQSVISGTTSKWEEMVENAKHFFSRLVPRISISSDQTNSISLDFDWEESRRDSDEILDLAEKIAVEKDLEVMVCIDEFQNTSNFTNPDSFQKKLRSHWQLQQHVGYCLYGSKRDMMLELFSSTAKPFYKFGDFIHLKKIDAEHLVAFFKKRFEDTGKSIEDAAAVLIAELVENHPHYAQQLAQGAWFRTESVCTEETVWEAHAALVDSLSLSFQNITNTLTPQQLCFLRAFIAGEKTLSSSDVLYRYGISSGASAVRSKASLLKNDILDDTDNILAFQDPIYAYWLKTVYFKK